MADVTSSFRTPPHPATKKGEEKSRNLATKNGNGRVAHDGKKRDNGVMEKTKKAVEGPTRGQNHIGVAAGVISTKVAEVKPAAGGEEGLNRRDLLGALTALKKGDFSVRLPQDLEGVDGKIADTFNEVIELNQRLAAEIERLSNVVGKEGKISQR